MTWKLCEIHISVLVKLCFVFLFFKTLPPLFIDLLSAAAFTIQQT